MIEMNCLEQVSVCLLPPVYRYTVNFLPCFCCFLLLFLFCFFCWRKRGGGSEHKIVKETGKISIGGVCSGRKLRTELQCIS